MQTRGADEPMTNFVTCLDCKNQFKCWLLLLWSLCY